MNAYRGRCPVCGRDDVLMMRGDVLRRHRGATEFDLATDGICSGSYGLPADDDPAGPLEVVHRTGDGLATVELVDPATRALLATGQGFSLSDARRAAADQLARRAGRNPEQWTAEQLDAIDRANADLATTYQPTPEPTPLSDDDWDKLDDPRMD